MPTRSRLTLSIAAVVVVCASCGAGSEPLVATPAPTAPAATASALPTPDEPSPEPSIPPPATPTATPAATVTVYFSTGDGTDCGEVSPFVRTITAGEQAPLLGSALTELLSGPTEAEIADGASSFFSSATAYSLAAVDFFPQTYVAIEFNDLASLIPNASTSCGSEALLAQLNNTVFQYIPPDLPVRYEMLASCQMFANWLQRECMEYTPDGAEPADLTSLERASGSGCEPWGYGPLDGDWFGYVESATATDVGFDLACWFDGDAAVDAAAEDGMESPPPNDYYIRNQDDTVTSILVAADAVVSWLPDIGDPSSETVSPFSAWLTERDGRPVQPGVWLKVRGGQVVEIVEQFVP